MKRVFLFLVDLLFFLLVRLLVGTLNILPLSLRIFLISRLIHFFIYIFPQHKKISYINLKLAFPEKGKEWYDKVYINSIDSLARVFVDFARLHTLDEKWVREHVECPYLEEYRSSKTEKREVHIFATGHLGSFEVLAHCVPFFASPISFVVRSFKLPFFNSWWRKGRERFGNRAIDRKGAFKEVMSDLLNGRDVGILFDQNVTRNHAIFVNFFGKPAATTKMVALAALRSKANVLVTSIEYKGNDSYKINAVPCDFSDIYDDQESELEAKVRKITQHISDQYEKMIRQNPNEWFWLHRRWKTRPEGEREDFYQ